MSKFINIPHCEFIINDWYCGTHMDLYGLFGDHEICNINGYSISPEADRARTDRIMGRRYTIEELYNVPVKNACVDYWILEDQLGGRTEKSLVRPIDDFFVVINADNTLTIWDHNLNYQNKDNPGKMLYRPVAKLDYMPFLNTVDFTCDEFTDAKIKKYKFDSDTDDYMAQNRLKQRTFNHIDGKKDALCFSVLFKTGVHKFTILYHYYPADFCLYEVYANKSNYDPKYKSGYYAYLKDGWSDVPASLLHQEGKHRLKIKNIFSWQYELEQELRKVKRAHASHFNRMYGCKK